MALSSRVNQRQIVFVNWKFPEEPGLLPHPAIVISTSDLFDAEPMFYAVLISSANFHPEYTVEISNSDLKGSDKLDHDSYVVTHFISYFELNDTNIQPLNAFVTKDKFEEIQNKIIKSVMGLDVE
jgi:hypothetical protein